MKNLRYYSQSAFLFCICLISSLHSGAQTLGEMSLDGVDKVVLQLTNANLVLNGNSELRRAKLGESQFSLEKNGNVATIRQNDFNNPPDTALKVGAANLEISGKVIVEIHGRDLRIDTQNWQSDMSAQANGMKLYVNNGVGLIQASALKIDLVTNEFKGRLKGDFQVGKVSFKGGLIDGEISLLNGDLSCEKTTGALTIQSFAAQIKALKCGGNWSVDNLKGGTVAQNWSGRFEGISQEGPFAVSLADEGDVNIKTQSGRVTLTPPVAASVALNLQSTEGDIVTPNYLKISKEGQKKFLKGRSQGQGERGSFYVRTQDGVIFVK